MKSLIATDGSESSEGAARLLGRFKFTPADEIIVLHVVPEHPFKDVQPSHLAGFKLFRREIAPKIIESTVRCLADCKARIATTVAEGHPDRAILDSAAMFNADLIVMGARGVKGIQSLFLGSVTRSVAINSSRPVLVIRLPHERNRKTLKVLFATDGSDDASGAARLLTALPFPDKTELTILHVSASSYLDIPERLYLEVDDRMKNLVAVMKGEEFKHVEAVLEKARESLAGAFPRISVVPKSGDPSEEILHTALIEQTDIIALGSRGMRGVRGMLGSVARNVLGHAECSVLIGKTRV